MRILGIIAIAGAVVSLILGIVARIMCQALPVLPGGLKSAVALDFANTCLLLAIAFFLAAIARKK